MASKFSIVKKGKDCLRVASEVLTQIKSGNSVEVLTRLGSLKQDALTLEKEAGYLVKRLEAVDNWYQGKDVDLSRQAGELGIRESQLKSEKCRIESSLAGQQSVLSSKESELSSAESNLQAAERKLRDAIEEEKNIQVGAIAGGALLGALTGGLGFLVGAGVGAGIGAIVNACRDEEKDARSARNRRRDDVESARSAIRQSESQISSLQSEINSLSSQISSREQQRAQLHKLRDEIKAAIPIVKKSTEFWHKFKLLSTKGGNRTALLEEIVAMANEKGDYHALQSAGSQHTANTFFEAWEEIESKASDGATNHMFSIDYTCVQCSTSCKELPHLSGSDFICSSCHIALPQ